MLLSYKMSPIYWPYVLDSRVFTFRQWQVIFFLLRRIQTGTSAPPVCLHGVDMETSYVYLFHDAISFYDYMESVMNE